MAEKEKIGLEHQIANLKGKMTAAFNKIKTTVEVGRNVEKDISQLDIFEARFQDLRSIYDQFEDYFNDLRLISIRSGKEETFPDQFIKSQSVNSERYYYECCAIHNSYKKLNVSKSFSGNETTDNPTMIDMNSSRARLPKINLPHFSGNLSDWTQFKDIFTSLVHNDTCLSPIEKFHYLLGATSGPPHKLLKTIPLMDANYTLAYKALLDRYDNRRILATSYIDTLLNFAPLQGKPSHASLQSLLSTISENIFALQAMAIPDLADFILFSLVVRLLDPITRREFELAHIKESFPTFTSLKNFLKIQCQIFEISAGYNPVPSSKPRPQGPKPALFSASPASGPSPRMAKPSSLSFAGASQKFICVCCKEAHRLVECSKFLALTPLQRFNVLKTNGACINCFSSNHMNKFCTSHYSCKKCHQKHHTLLHFNSGQSKPIDSRRQGSPEREPPPVTFTGFTASNLPGPSATVLSSRGCDLTVLLGTAVAYIYDCTGACHPVRLVLDSGSHYSFITSKLADSLGLPQFNFKQPISGVGQSMISGVNRKVCCTLTPRDCSEPRLITEAIIVRSITGNLPTTPLPSSVKDHITSLNLADPHFWEPAPVDFLLGSDLFMSVVTGGKLSFSESGPSGLATIFGWVMMGEMRCNIPSSPSLGTSLFLASSPPSIDDLVKNFWELEEPISSKAVNPEDLECERHFKDTHSRDPLGRYIVKLPFKQEETQLSDCRKLAFARFFKLEQRLLHQPQVYKEYNSVLKEYLELGHMSIANIPSPYLLPHHGVIKEESSSTKLRVVFNASFKAMSCSLNDCLLAGPKLQLDIGDIILNFRRHPVVFTSDICKMYRQIWLHQTDRKFQHFLWRFSPEEEVQEFELNTVTFGFKCAPFQALRVLRQLVFDEGQHFPLASQAILDDIYIDNIVTGAEDVPTALEKQRQLIELLLKGGFPLRKWSSNCSALLATVPLEDQEIPVCLSSKEDNVIKVLGLQWDPSRDSFSYNIQPPAEVIYSKRAVLSTIARIYDPLGFLSPVVFYAKDLLQQLWQLKLDWDQDLPENIKEIWFIFIGNLSKLSKLTIPRHIFPINLQSCQLLGFCDASEKGYSGAFYIRTVSDTGQVDLYLLKAKTKLAPLKTISIPRLELCGALLLSRVFQSLETFYNAFQIDHVYLFTDSTVVLCWLSTSPHRLKTFVANRVSTILRLTPFPLCSWHHISTNQNPSDCASRGVPPGELLGFNLWWKGPSFAYLPPNNWFPEGSCQHPVVIPELKSEKSISLMVSAIPDVTSISWMERFKSFSALQLFSAYILRLKLHFKTHEGWRNTPATYHELSTATYACIKLIQAFYFHKEFERIASLSCSKTLARLTPFVDEEGLIRVGGRLRHSDLPSKAKHPVLLPAKCHFVKLLVDYLHKIYLHAGPSTLQSLIQQEYWILGARSLIRYRIFRCTTCFRLKAISKVPIMGNLPASRFVQGRPFMNIAVDFAGPFLIKESSRRNSKTSKAYLCIFVCMATKAVHLETVSSLSSDAFLACLDRFIARRGLCFKIYSDCGTNFVGAARQLKELAQLLKHNETVITNHLTSKGITWVFQPPYAPNFNGLAEAGVKSVKYHLTRIVGDKPLTFEELATVFARIEAVLNSRPLTPLSTNPTELNVLTPGHFLVGGPLVARPEQDSSDVPINRLDRWQLLQRFVQHFWNRWSSEYLHTLQQRSKWTKPIKNCAEGDLVLLKSSTPPLNWPLARIVSTHPGEDGVVRVVTVKTDTGVFKRPMSKVIPFPVDSEVD